MRYAMALICISLLLGGACPEACAGEVVYPRLLLQTPFVVEKVLGRPDQVEDVDGLVQWRYLIDKRYDPKRDAVVGTVYLRCSYLKGRLVSLEASPSANPTLPSDPRLYVPANVSFKVDEYDATEERARTTTAFANAHVKGSVKLSCPPLKGEKLAPSGLYTVQWDFSKVWQGQALEVRLAVNGRYFSQLKSDGRVSEEALKAVSQLPVKG